MEKLQIKTDLDGNIETVKALAAKKAEIKLSNVKYFRITKRSIDARDKRKIIILWSVEIDSATHEDERLAIPMATPPTERIAVIGSGPAGLFSALVLARAGLKPLVIERGGNVDKRAKDVEGFIKTRKLNTESNIQFGEGGAGTFSDGKLNTGVRSEYKDFILKEFVAHGAPDCILYDAKPHIGSDKLPQTVKAIREEIISLCGEFMFDTAVVSMVADNGKISALEIKKGEKSFQSIKVSKVILATGHSSRDTFQLLYNLGTAMERKDMAVGVRIEHSAAKINETQYGKDWRHTSLSTADYKLTSSASDRGVFTFCMCPGGYVMPATSEEGAVVTNGMSCFKRDAVNSNSAVIVQTFKADYGDGNVLKGIDFQRDLERHAFEAGGSDYCAPVSLLGDFMKGTVSSHFYSVKPSYEIGTRFADFNKLLPSYIATPLKKGIADMARRLKGFDSPEAVLTAAETRTSSPVRVIRNDETLTSLTFSNLYPAGEVGYAGGIMSAAADGVKIALAIIGNFVK